MKANLKQINLVEYFDFFGMFMIILKLSSVLSKEEIITKSKKFNIVVVSPKLIKSQDQLELGFLLAKKSFSDKTNIAKTFELELLLWLAGERNISAVLEKNEFDPKNFIAIVKNENFSKKTILRELCAKQKPFLLKRRVSPLEIEEISLSRL